MLKHVWIWWICSLMLVGCLPKALTPMISTPNAPMPMVSTSTLTASIPVSSMPITLTPMTPDPYPQALVINEYLLSAQPSTSTLFEEKLVFYFANGNQDEILARTEKYRDYSQQIAEYNNKVLKSFDYRQEDYQKEQDEGSGYFSWYSNIYHGDKKIVSDALFVRPVSVNTSGTDFITKVEAFGGTYLLTSDIYEKRPGVPGREPYAYVEEQLLSIEIDNTAFPKSSFKVYIGDELKYKSNDLYDPFIETSNGPWSYNGHWAIAFRNRKQDSQGNWQIDDRLVQDGQDINDVMGYEQSFQFAVLDSRPFYFYQKNGKIGISFDGQEIDKEYDEIPHYNCCSPALLNPRVTMNMVWFLARRGADWYYVEAYIPE